MNGLKYVFRKHEIIAKNPVISILSVDDLAKMASDRSRFLSMYKQFYKLRFIIDKKKINQDNYVALVRRYFGHHDFNQRRKNLFPELEPLSRDEIFDRMVRTQVFVFNSTVAVLDEEHQDALYFQETHVRERIEKSIVLTILRMDHEKPDEIKYDFKYEWVPRLRHSLENLPSDSSPKKYKSFTPGSLHWIGFQKYEENLMRLNETHQLCL